MIERSTRGLTNNRMKRKPPRRPFRVSGFTKQASYGSVERWLDQHCANMLETQRKRNDLGRSIAIVVGELL